MARKRLGWGVTIFLEGAWWLLEMLAIFFSQYWPSWTFELTFLLSEKTHPIEYARLRICVWHFLPRIARYKKERHIWFKHINLLLQSVYKKNHMLQLSLIDGGVLKTSVSPINMNNNQQFILTAEVMLVMNIKLNVM